MSSENELRKLLRELIELDVITDSLAKCTIEDIDRGDSPFAGYTTWGAVRNQQPKRKPTQKSNVSKRPSRPSYEASVMNGDDHDDDDNDNDNTEREADKDDDDDDGEERRAKTHAADSASVTAQTAPTRTKKRRDNFPKEKIAVLM